MASDNRADDSFSMIVLPDTQYYVGRMDGGTPELFYAQTRWIVENRTRLNIAYACHVGDLVEHAEIESEWEICDRAMSTLEDRRTTELPDGIPYGVAVGNHDKYPLHDSRGSTALFNKYFGISRFERRSYYGGHRGADNDNHFDLISASGLDFVIVHLEYDATPENAASLSWADAVLKEHSDRRAIVVSHYILEQFPPPAFSFQGQATYDALKPNANLFLMLCGHFGPHELRRTDTHNGNEIYTLLADYQWGKDHGGDAYLRIMTFCPSRNQIDISTYSPVLDRFETGPDSEFSLPYDMGGTSE